MRSPVPAIVLGLNPNALGTVRSLAAAGIPVIAIERQPSGPEEAHTWMSLRTRLCRKIILPTGATDDALLAALVELGPTLPGPAPILPSGDADVLFLATHEQLLRTWYRFHLPADDVIRLMIEKTGFHDFAASVGVPVPATFPLQTPEQLALARREVRFPCIVKPELRDDRWDTLFAPRKGLVARDLEEFDSTHADAQRAGAALVAQEIIPGPDSELFFSHVYYGAAGAVLGAWSGHKIRQAPIHFGTSTLAETAVAPETIEYTHRLLAPHGYRGYASVEFKRDPRDGSFRVLEATIGRTWYPHYLGMIAGLNLPALWYHDLMGDEPVASSAEVRYGVRWIDEYRDLIAALSYYQAGELTVAEWLRSLVRIRGAALFAWNDPLPAFFVLLRLALHVRNVVANLLGLRKHARPPS